MPIKAGTNANSDAPAIEVSSAPSCASMTASATVETVNETPAGLHQLVLLQPQRLQVGNGRDHVDPGRGGDEAVAMPIAGESHGSARADTEN
jgi:hypothetical protein